MSSDTGIQEQRRDIGGGFDSSASALAVISQELMESIRNAHLALEDCVDGRGGSAALVRSGQLLHQVSGALKMTETYGAALLAEEMQEVCSYLANLRAGKGREDGLDALTRAMVQLPIYIERLLGGGRDIALVLLPMLNDLRAARGRPLLSEGTLLLLNLSPNKKAPDSKLREASGEDPVFVATKLRPKFQLALLGWIKGGDATRHLKTLSSVAAALQRAANRDDMFQLWWVVGGVLESLQNGGLETSVALKRLLGQADRQMKLMIDKGETAFDEHPVTDLLNNLLYYVARSSNAGERISEIRAAFNLSELLPGDEQVEHARESLSAPSVKLMQTVASAIKEDLARVKDVLDIYVRTGMNKPSELVPQLDLLKKISDTLGVLGLGELRGDIESEIESLKTIVQRGGVAKEQTILEIASTLLKVEDRLDRQLVRLISPEEPVPPGEDGRVVDSADPDYTQVAEAVMRESIINLARIKETFSQSLTSPGDSHGLDSIPALIRGIKAGLLMLNKTRAMEVVDRVGNLLLLSLRGSGPRRLTQKETDRLADAIVSIEYYMETVKAGRREPWYMLDNAEACLAVLRDLEIRLTKEKTEEPPAAQTMRASREEIAAAQASQPAPLQATEVMPMAVVSRNAEHLDPELLELFIEEAKEEIVSIKRNLPQWAEAPDDMETLITVRRSFHTLKGSGRMVGAERIGEYSWAIENLLNKLINRTLARTPPMVNFISQAAAVVPELVEQLEVGTEPLSDVSLFMARAAAFADGDPNAAILTIAPRSDVAKAPEPTPLEMDPVLLDIFSKETAGHLKVIHDYIEACRGHRPPFHVTDKLHRACHTLHGSANMANVERGVAVAGALNRLVRRVYDHKVGFQQSGVDALKAGAKAIATIVGDINQSERSRSNFAVLIEHLNNLANSVQPLPEPDADTEPEDAIVEEVQEEISDEAGYDAEIAAIFSEEAAELLEAADQALAAWSKNKKAREHVEELKRHLHTLKGGARMSGIAAMGNLSHELETLLINIDDGRIDATPQTDEILQQSIDELHRMRDTVIAGKKVSPAAELESRIRRINSGEIPAAPVETPAAEEEDLDTGDSVSVEFSIEPEDTVSMVIVDSPLNAEVQEIAARQQAAPEPEPPHVEPAKAPEPPPPVEAEKPARAEKPPPRPVPSTTPLQESIEPAALAEVRPLPSRGGEARQEFARIDAELLEDLLNAAGEISIYHSRLSQQVKTIEFHVEELEQTVARLRDQLRKLEIETEAQIMHGHQETLVAQDFDPLELDRYSNIQQLSRALAESANDLNSLKDLLRAQISEAETLLVQQQRVTAELQDGLMRTRMVPFQRHVPRLTRLVRQAAVESGKRAELAVEGASGELDRQVLDKMLPPFEHMMRNAVAHGIEKPDARQAAGKPATGRITIRLHREGAEMVIDVADDGSGLNVAAIRRKAFEKGLLKPDSKVSDEEIMQLILTPGFSTASSVTQTAGRGVGMDVVANEIKKLGGSLQISSVTGQGTNFTIRLPFTLAITQALIVRTGDEVYALPLPTVEGVARISRAELERMLSHSEPSYEYGEQTYRFRHLGMYLGGQSAKLPEDDTFVPVILVRAGDHSAALLTDEMIASQEIVVKSLGPQLSSVRGISGATILGDGRIVLILDINALVRQGAPVVELKKAAPTPSDQRPLALVVDDSITVRRVMERFLQRNGMRVATAKDGLDAISVLSESKPDIILLDIEMPRMDGYEFAKHVRNDERVADVPIIMITSRSGDKHRARAIEIGVNDYLGKPYQDSRLLESIRRLLEERGIQLA
ncbi:MAG: Hpt domain-containing protein [Gammaproteobacteria bacterium]|nr:Hpt domain-containing protein [Gammaproteobacteria bacterium]MDH4314217.1 Hpt domain-containing protein [Gammaproteobacteria bacterium]MDH5213248.1 Hpt domain-containing protein [Gammaproteobacteria bacterium]MDH5499485.1 Hpt domain-containing protein [Gammaproteobacteria bacterium]